MEFLRKLIIVDYWYWYSIISALFGVFLCFVLKKTNKWNTFISVLICVVNAYWLGAIILFRCYYNARSFWVGGMIGLIVIVISYILLRNKIIYLAGGFICARVLCVFLNMFVENDTGRVEECIIFCSYIFSILFIMAIEGYLLNKEKLKFEDVMRKIFFPLYGSCLITGCWFDFFYDIVYKMEECLIEKNEYINFYKYIIKIDWKEDGGVIIFVAMFLFISLLGCVIQNHNISNK